MDDTRKVKQNFRRQLEGIRTTERPRSRWWECFWTDIKERRITNWRETSRNRNELKKDIEEAKVHLGPKKKKKKKKKKTKK
jgi:hypothetical protein